MKKALIVFVALMLAVPAVSYAGSATSRWDMTLGGYVKFDAVWATQAVGPDNRIANAGNSGNRDVALDSTNSLTWQGGETRLNWAVKGPDAWGAKTSAFVEGEFRGRTGGSENGLFAMRHAYFQMIWPKTQLLIGHTWQAWGMIPSLNTLSFSENHFNKGALRTPQIRLTQAFTKNFTGVFAVQAPYSTSNTVGATNNTGIEPRANSSIPDLVADFSYASDACGKIGPFGLKIGVGGFWGKDEYLMNIAPGASATSAVTLSKEKLDRYGAGFYWYVPIIPERKGNKAGALGFTGQLFAGKGMNAYLPAYGTATMSTLGAYNRSGLAFISGTAVTNLGTSPANLAYVPTTGGWVQGTLYFTDKFFMNAVYGAQYNNYSSAFINAQSPVFSTPAALANTATIAAAAPRKVQNFIVNVMYDVNPAIRFGLEYSKVTTSYTYRSGAYSNGTISQDFSSQGNFDTIRMGAYYFF